MTEETLSTVETPSLPTLLELLDTGSVIHGEGDISFPARRFEVIRRAAEALQQERADLRAELATKADEFMMVAKQLEILENDYAEEEKEADKYAKLMHASDDLAAHLYEFVLANNLKLPGDKPELEEALSQVLVRTQRKGQDVSAPLAKLEAKREAAKAQQNAPLVTLEA